MPIGITTAELNGFFNGAPTITGGHTGTALNQLSALSPFGKSIQKAFRYYVTILPDFKKITDANRAELYAKYGNMPLIRSWHVSSITIPTYVFDKEQQHYGPVSRSFAVMKHDGFEVKIDFEEDQYGTIANFIWWMQRLMINPENGQYHGPDFYKIPSIGVITENDFGAPIGVYTLHDAFYLSSSSLDLDYSKSEKITYSVVFNVDIINAFFPQAYSIQKVTP